MNRFFRNIDSKSCCSDSRNNYSAEERMLLLAMKSIERRLSHLKYEEYQLVILSSCAVLIPGLSVCDSFQEISTMQEDLELQLSHLRQQLIDFRDDQNIVHNLMM